MISFKAQVVRVTGKEVLVKDNKGAFFKAFVRGKFRIKAIASTTPVVVGDMVLCRVTEEQEEVLIYKRLERKNAIFRKSVKLSKMSHCLASNIDLAVLVVTVANPKNFLEFIDRFAVTAEASKVPLSIVFNKTDILNDIEANQLQKWMDIYQKLYPCYKTSVVKNEGFLELKSKLEGKLTFIFGISGVGKSSIINKINPKLNLKTSDISEQNRQGKHTTSYTEIHHAFNSTYLIDSPGVKSFGIVDMTKEVIRDGFKEFFNLAKGCKYKDCYHINEPKCAVKMALENNEVSETRYKSYLNILSSLEEDTSYRKMKYSAK